MFNPKKIIFLSSLLITSLLHANSLPSFPQQPLSVISNGSDHYPAIAEMLNKFEITYQQVNATNFNDDRLYLIFNLNTMAHLPTYYIAYQTEDLTQNPLTTDYLQKLSHAVAVWDYSKENIIKYAASLRHYHHLPPNYEFADPVLLPCFLPCKALKAYRDILAYSNELDTDISSHLPTIFCYSILQNPHLIIEAGVRGGESTIALRHALDRDQCHLIGIDIDPLSANVYAGINNAQFLCMDDRNFYNFYRASEYNKTPADLIFIDTSHTYLHTMQEIALFEKLLPEQGVLLFHDSNVTPLNANTSYVRLNGTSGYAVGNTRGVTQAIKEYFSLSFDEYQYVNTPFTKNGSQWHIIHYPFCNGLTIIRLLRR